MHLQSQTEKSVRNALIVFRPVLVVGASLVDTFHENLIPAMDSVMAIHKSYIEDMIVKPKEIPLFPSQAMIVDMLIHYVREEVVSRLAEWAQEWGEEDFCNALLNAYVKTAGYPDKMRECEREIPLSQTMMLVLKNTYSMLLGEAYMVDQTAYQVIDIVHERQKRAAILN